MKIVINNQEFMNAEWMVSEGVGIMAFPSEDSILDVLNEIGESENINIYNDEDVLEAIWQNGGFCGARIDYPDSVRTIYISFKVSIINDNTEKRIDGDISESVDAIMELAEMIADTEETVGEHEEEITKLKAKDEEFHDAITDINNKIDSMPTDVVERFSAVWESYSSLADRVARLENKEA